MPAGSTAARPLAPASQRWRRRCQEATAHCQQRCGQAALAAALPTSHSCAPSGAAQQAALCALLRYPQRRGRTGAASGQRQSQRSLGAAPATTWLCPPAALAQNRERIGAQAPRRRGRPLRTAVLYRISSRRSCVVRFRVWNTSSHVILTADYINAAVFCTTWSTSILFSLDVAVGLWPLLREGLRPSRLRPGALTRSCAS
jgi:hypothetical protein